MGSSPIQLSLLPTENSLSKKVSQFLRSIEKMDSFEFMNNDEKLGFLKQAISCAEDLRHQMLKQAKKASIPTSRNLQIFSFARSFEGLLEMRPTYALVATDQKARPGITPSKPIERLVNSIKELSILTKACASNDARNYKAADALGRLGGLIENELAGLLQPSTNTKRCGTATALSQTVGPKI